MKQLSFIPFEVAQVTFSAVAADDCGSFGSFCEIFGRSYVSRLFFMMAKQQPFSDPDVATAVNSCLAKNIQLEKYEDFQGSPELNPGNQIEKKHQTGR